MLVLGVLFLLDDDRCCQPFKEYDYVVNIRSILVVDILWSSCSFVIFIAVGAVTISFIMIVGNNCIIWCLFLLAIKDTLAGKMPQVMSALMLQILNSASIMNVTLILFTAIMNLSACFFLGTTYYISLSSRPGKYT